MSSTPTPPDAVPEADEAHRHSVDVSLEITNEEGESQTSTVMIESGPTKVTKLNCVLGLPEVSALGVIDNCGKNKPLGDHETFNVKADDRFQAIVRGGVS